MSSLVGIDLTQDGKQHGHLAISHSVHRSAYGKIVIPVCYVRNGEGPRALLTAGVHGDEFEGQIALRQLALEIDVAGIQGSLLIVPMANAPAVEASLRVSPLDDLNLNRVFPGHALGWPTEAIAYAIETQLMAHCDYAFDIHSGGTSLHYDAVAITTATGEVTEDAARIELLNALGLERGMVLSANGTMALDRSQDGAMLRQGVIGVSAEFGGGGTLSREWHDICETSIWRFLCHVGLLRGAVEAARSTEMTIFNVDEPEAYVFAMRSGIFVSEVELGQLVKKDDVMGKIYDLLDLSKEPIKTRCETTGAVLCLRALPRVEIGDCLAQIGIPVA